MVEVDYEEGSRQLNDCLSLHLQSIREVEALALEVVVLEAKPQAHAITAQEARLIAAKSGSPLERILVGARMVEPDATCRLFRLIFGRQLVLYTVLNESYGTYPRPPEQFSGKLFRTYSWSHLLEFTRQTTCASDEYPGVLQHYAAVCEHHVVDVICTARPTIFLGNGALAKAVVH